MTGACVRLKKSGAALFVRHRHMPMLRTIYGRLPASLRLWISSRVTAWGRTAIADMRFPDTLAWRQPVELARPRAGSLGYLESDGLNVFGFFDGRFGLAESARLYTRALLECGVPLAIHNLPRPAEHDGGDREFDGLYSSDMPYPVSLVFANPGQLSAADLARIRARTSDNLIVGCWFWELPRIPNAWQAALADVDAVLVASEFIEKAMIGASDKPVLRVPVPIAPRADSGLSRADFGLRDDVYVFLTSFDYHSSFARKNPLGAVQAFREAFPAGDEAVALLVKSTHAREHPFAAHALLSAADGDPRIIFVDQNIDAAHRRALQRCCDAYLSLHRAEGFGLGMAEFALTGKPVIATGWSGSVDFLAGSPYAVDCRLRELRNDEYPHSHGEVWAEPDLAHAARLMKKAVDGPRRMPSAVAEFLDPLRNSESLVRAIESIRRQAHA
ncbi:glycosyl transferase [Lysobacter oculi]|uniref:Glycosyl transferase n=2 Tax=Solilutibacter oculi TaxID=2698682 RepID=A0A344J6S2_9GAMM|nr:glycosyl transferase [Lysobacter oculi]